MNSISKAQKIVNDIQDYDYLYLTDFLTDVITDIPLHFPEEISPNYLSKIVIRNLNMCYYSVERHNIMLDGCCFYVDEKSFWFPLREQDAKFEINRIKEKRHSYKLKDLLKYSEERYLKIALPSPYNLLDNETLLEKWIVQVDNLEAQKRNVKCHNGYCLSTLNCLFSINNTNLIFRGEEML